VAAGASLHANGAKVTGPITTRSAARVELSGSVLVGPISLRGGVTVLSLVGNHITGPVSIRDNLTGSTPIVVSANTIIGTLACSGNVPPPVNDGKPNSVTGPVTGQCTGL
jgi:hypothetical protein